MDFELSAEQQALADAAAKLCADFGNDYWRRCDQQGEFPEAFVQAVADGGWLGIAMPEAYGGAGQGITEAALFAHAVARSGAGMSGASAVHINLFGPHPVVVFGTDAQREAVLPPLIQGKDRVCFGVTEPDAGLNTTALTTRATRVPGGYRISGQKLWTSTAQVANKILLIARTTAREDAAKATDGLTLFYTDLNREAITVNPIAKMGRAAVDSNALFIDGLFVPEEHRIGAEGDGWRCLLHGLNPERILIAAEAVGLGQAALERAARYARERVVFGRPIGQNQGIAHPLAECWMALEAAWLMTLRAASRYDAGLPCGADANAAKYLAAEAAFKACERAVLTHGGMGYAKEYDVERLFREVMIPRIAPVSQEMIRNFIAEQVLEQPRSY
ncbi:MAG: acyl-CoA/acyl-ACP dehydrogenase [Pseudomonadales bacterium]|jgi:acyl-CoA dehydrogenase|nr:acyl-CoA/acyl-ACP dehydrogenase [Pseudomonadales bacterium]